MKFSKEGLKTELIFGIEFYIFEGDFICKKDVKVDFNLKIIGNVIVEGNWENSKSEVITGWQEIGESQEIGGLQKIGESQEIGRWQKIGESQKIGRWQEIGESQEIGGWQEIGGSQKIGGFYILPDALLGTAYKLVTDDYMSPIQSTKLKYEIGSKLSIDCDMDISCNCSFGINIANWKWILKNKQSNDNRVLIVKYDTSPENLCVPNNSDGKFRVKECEIIGEVPDNMIPWKAGKNDN